MHYSIVKTFHWSVDHVSVVGYVRSQHLTRQAKLSTYTCIEMDFNLRKSTYLSKEGSKYLINNLILGMVLSNIILVFDTNRARRMRIFALHDSMDINNY